jgi:hypothetical protein
MFRSPSTILTLALAATATAEPMQGELTPEQVAAAFKAVQAHGCTHAGYAGKLEEKPIGRRNFSFLPDLPKDPVDLLDPYRYYHVYGQSRYALQSYALRFPERTTDADLNRLAVALARLPYLRSLDLGGAKGVSDAGMAALKGVGADLEGLFLDGTAIGDAGLKALAESAGKLRWLDLAQTRITDKGLTFVGQHKALRHLNLENIPAITDEGIARIDSLGDLATLDLSGTSVQFKNIPLEQWAKLRRLDLSHTPIGDDGVKALAALKSLEELDLRATAVTGTGLAELAKLPNLKIVRLSDAAITDDGAKGIGALAQIRVLHVHNSMPPESKKPVKVALTDEGLTALGGCKSLRELNLARTKIHGNGFKGFAGHATLRDLDLEGSAVSALAFTELRAVPNLRSLNLARTAITGDGLQLLAEQKYLSRINLEESKANDPGMNLLARVRSLRDLNLAGTNVGAAGLKELENNTITRLDLSRTRAGGDALKTISGMRSLRGLFLIQTDLAASSAQLTKALPECSVVTQPPAKAPPPPASTRPPRVPVEN